MSAWLLPRVNDLRCMGCGLCETNCPGHAVQVTEQLPRFVHPESCTYCGLCEELCPTAAIALVFEIHWAVPNSQLDL